MVPKKGLEPSRLAALDPKSSVSTNSTTSAHILTKFLIISLVPYSSIPVIKNKKLRWGTWVAGFPLWY